MTSPEPFAMPTSGLQRPPIRTLVLDDDAAMVRLVKKILEKTFGDLIVVTGLVDGEQALGMAIANQVDLCITDLDMPRINGLMCLKSLKASNPLTQVIILTAHPDENAIRSAFTMGADDYLMKPINTEALRQVVGYLIAKIIRVREDIFDATMA